MTDTNKFQLHGPVVKQGFGEKKGTWMPTYKQRWFILQREEANGRWTWLVGLLFSVLAESRLFYFVNQQQPPAFADEPQGLCEKKKTQRHAEIINNSPVFFSIQIKDANVTASGDVYMAIRDNEGRVWFVANSNKTPPSLTFGL
jgi:hypothetical protein